MLDDKDWMSFASSIEDRWRMVLAETIGRYERQAEKAARKRFRAVLVPWVLLLTCLLVHHCS